MQKHFSNRQNYICKRVCISSLLGVHVVGDRYHIPDEVSLKCDEQLRGNQAKFSTEYIPVDNIENPDWNALLKIP